MLRISIKTKTIMATFHKELYFMGIILNKIAITTLEIAIDAIRNFPKTNDFLKL